MVSAEKTKACCYDCGREYGDEHGFPDLVVPHDDWVKISPTGNHGGLLCPSCICKHLHEAGIETYGGFTSGPLCDPNFKLKPPYEPDTRWRTLITAALFDWPTYIVAGILIAAILWLIS